MSNITVAKAQLPAHIAARVTDQDLDDSLSSGVGGGYPVISIRGSKWRIVQNGEEKPVYIPGTDDMAPSIEVVVLKANAGMSKVFYATKYVEGSDAAPDCFSHDGIAPDPTVEKPQSSRCSTCKQNVWGAKINENGKKTKACADSRRLAVVPAGELNNPMLLRVPAASLADLAEYGRALNRKGVPKHAVVTKLSFDSEAAYPKLVFKPARYLNEEEFAQVLETRDSPVIDEIIGVPGTPHTPGLGHTNGDDIPGTPPTGAAAPAPAPAPAPEPEAKPEPVAAPVVEMKAKKPKAAPKPEAGSKEDDLNAQLDTLLEGFDV